MLQIKNKSLDKQILIGSILCFGYFLMQYLFHLYKVETILAGVLTELITIPFLLLMVALFAAIIWLFFVKKEGNKQLLLLSFIFLVATVCLMVAI